MPDGEARKSYHHGDARNALLTAAAELLETQGAAGLSLRQVAERAGLSRQAPYNHFADKQALLASLAAMGFGRLERDLRNAVDGLAGEATLAASGEAYMTFAETSPAMFRLMFSRELVDIARFPEAQLVAASAYAALTDVIAMLVPPARVENLSLAAWSMVHGFATLCIEGAIAGPTRLHERATDFARLVTAAAGQPDAKRSSSGCH